MKSVLRSLFCAALLAGPAHAADPVSLAKVAIAPDSFKGQTLTVDASLGMMVAQNLMSQCKRKEKAVIVMPPIVGGEMGALSTVMFQACVSTETALTLADVSGGTRLQVTGEVRVVRTMGVLTAIVFDGASVAIGAPATAVPAP